MMARHLIAHPLRAKTIYYIELIYLGNFDICIREKRKYVHYWLKKSTTSIKAVKMNTKRTLTLICYFYF